MNIEDHRFGIAQWRDSLTDDHGCPCWNDHRPKEVLEMLARWEEAVNEVVRLRERLAAATSQNYCTMCGNTLDGYAPASTPMPLPQEFMDRIDRDKQLHEQNLHQLQGKEEAQKQRDEYLATLSEKQPQTSDNEED